MVTPTYTNLLLQLAIRLDPRAKPASPLCEQRNVPLATAVRCLTPVADKNQVATADQHADRTAHGKDGDTTDRDQHTEGTTKQIPVPPPAPKLVQAPAERSQSSNSAEGYAEKETEGKKLRSTREVAIAFSTSGTLPSAVTISPSGSYKNFKASASNRLVDGVQIRSQRDHVLRHLIGERHELLQVTVRSGATPADGTRGRWEDKSTLTCHGRALRTNQTTAAYTHVQCFRALS